MFLNNEPIGHIEQPDEDIEKITVDNPEHFEMLMGCHKSEDDPTKRNFSAGCFDELAIWRRWLDDSELPLFLGGHSE